MIDASGRPNGPVVVLDGGMGKELERMGAPFDQPEWSALALLEDPDTVAQAHRNFVDAGAEVIIANTYAVVPFHIGEDRFRERGHELANLAGRLARQVVDEVDRRVRVAASIPPVFGSYQPDRFDPVRAPELLRVLIEAQAPWVDLWLVETIGSCLEAEVAVAALDRAGVTGERWLSYSLADADPELVEPEAPVLWSGESVTKAAEVAVAAGAEAVLLNCATPEAIGEALPELVAALDQSGSPALVGAYANGFEPRPAGYAANEVILDRRQELTPERYAQHAETWIERGASVVGGCCSIHPEHIAELARRV